MDSAAALGAEGPIAAKVSGFAVREAQQEMAAAVEHALENGETLIAEAGTGTGKTFAYLVPALRHDGRVIISTGTRNLQDQLFHKDLPLVRDALAPGRKVALLKGRSNYLCLQRLDRTLASGRLGHRKQVDELARVQEWSKITRSGDIAEVDQVAENSPLWFQVTSSADNCLGQDCPQLQDCHVLKARRAAQDADVLVINHHLFFADMTLKEEGFGELLPGVDAIILDEAHQLPETAGQFFGTRLSTSQFLDLSRDVITAKESEAPDSEDLHDRAQLLQQHATSLRQLLPSETQRSPWSEVANDATVKKGVDEVSDALEKLEAVLAAQAERGKALEHCHERVKELITRWAMLTGDGGDNNVHWFETHARSLSISLTPLDIAPIFATNMARYESAWVFTSATLAVGESFDHFRTRMGLTEASLLRLDSPFDFRRHALLYHPQNMPEPQSEDYGRALIEAAIPVLNASGGRAFMLFTSYRAMRDAAQRLEGEIDYPMMIQGSLPKDELLRQFREAGNAVLLGTSSFWEGVDVRGEALSCVIIDKLPFASPGDPVLQARIDALRKKGGNPFVDYQLPRAVIALKQGVGRLIRDVDDTGVLMLADPRLLGKSYGSTFLESLPPMTRTRQIERVQRFFEHTNAVTADA